MPLSPEQELLEHELRVHQMQTNISQMEKNIQKMNSDLKYENRRFLLQALVAAAALLGSGAAIGGFMVNYVDHHQARSIPEVSGTGR